jgi:tRNA nucleotidyltransferase (CCA-adding enzyme)
MPGHLSARLILAIWLCLGTAGAIAGVVLLAAGAGARCQVLCLVLALPLTAVNLSWARALALIALFLRCLCTMNNAGLASRKNNGVSMKSYLVGGAVRDELLGLSAKDRDHVVIGATPAMMIAAGFRLVGIDFTVGLHPQTQEEYALARTLRKSAGGAHDLGDDSAHVTLEDDLARRDLTINSMAKAEDGTIIDPYGGRADLKNRVLRHTSEAFQEDPLRVLRTARFMARFGAEWTIAPGTWALMRSMCAAGEVDRVPADRIWAEVQKGLKEPHPELMLSTMDHLGLLSRPAFAAYAGARAPDVEALRAAVAAGCGVEVLFALAVPALATDSVMSLARIPVPVRDAAVAFRAGLAAGLADFDRLAAEERLNVVEVIDAVRQKERLRHVLAALDCYNGGDAASVSVRSAAAALRTINQPAVINGATDAQTIRDRIRAARIDAIATSMKVFHPTP